MVILFTAALLQNESSAIAIETPANIVSMAEEAAAEIEKKYPEHKLANHEKP